MSMVPNHTTLYIAESGEEREVCHIDTRERLKKYYAAQASHLGKSGGLHSKLK